MPRFLKPPQDHHRHQVADVQAIGRRIEPGVERPHTFIQPFGELRFVGRLMDQAAPFQVGDNIGGHEWLPENRRIGSRRFSSACGGFGAAVWRLLAARFTVLTVARTPSPTGGISKFNAANVEDFALLIDRFSGRTRVTANSILP
jgi:hypothetical protein